MASGKADFSKSAKISNLGAAVLLAAADATDAEIAAALASGGSVCGGVADQVDEQAAHDAAPATGATIAHSARIFRFTDAVAMTKALALIGAGARATQMIQKTADKNLFEFTGQNSGLRVAHLRADGVAGIGDNFVLSGVHRCGFDDIATRGAGRFVWHLKGSLIHVFKNLMIGGGNLAASGEGENADFVAGIYAEVSGGVKLTGTITGTFQLGELVTGSVSGATGRVTAIAAGYITLDSEIGSFTTTDTCTGGTSEATIGTITAVEHPGTACNGLTFLGLTVEGGSYGILFANQDNEGTNSFFGGVLEAQKVRAAKFIGCTGVQLIGQHFENGTAPNNHSEVELVGCDNFRIFPAIGVGVILGGTCRNIVMGGDIGTLDIDSGSRNCKVENARLDMSNLVNRSLSTDIIRGRDSSYEGSNVGPGIYSRGYLFNANCDLQTWVGGLPVGYYTYGTLTGYPQDQTITELTGANAVDFPRGKAAGIVKSTAGVPGGMGLIVPAVLKGQYISIESLIETLVGIYPRCIIWLSAGAAVYAIPMSYSADLNKFQAFCLYPSNATEMKIIFGGSIEADLSIKVGSIRCWSEYNPVDT